jgi:hypothetical protein
VDYGKNSRKAREQKSRRATAKAAASFRQSAHGNGSKAGEQKSRKAKEHNNKTAAKQRSKRAEKEDWADEG